MAGATLLDRVAADHSRVRKVWVDGGYRRHLVEHAATLGIDREITAREHRTMGFTPILKRWRSDEPTDTPSAREVRPAGPSDQPGR
ncbi:hypothetical protein SNE510_75690 [Streptomyces sp. NE5-10]|nr:hypothetical protein [Streptomyces sp. NE5-10]GHJ98050.1 hypothetical protein SNE510_75690 [Streptomyces sp. NE5-10]